MLNSVVNIDLCMTYKIIPYDIAICCKFDIVYNRFTWQMKLVERNMSLCPSSWSTNEANNGLL